MRNKNEKNSSLEKILLKMFAKAPDGLTGKKEIWENKYRERFGDKDCAAFIKEEKLKLFKTYVYLILGMCLLLLFLIITQILDSGELQQINRPPYGEAPKKVDVRVKAEYKKNTVEKDLNISVQAKKLTKKEKEEVLRNYGKKLEVLMLVENDSKEKISGDLYFPEMDEDTGIVLSWESSNLNLINEKGEVNLFEVKKKEKITIYAKALLEDVIKEYTYFVFLEPMETKVGYVKLIEKKLTEIEKSLSENRNNKALKLPTSLNEGVTLHWGKKASQPIGLIIIGFTVLILLVYRKKFNLIDKQLKESKEAFTLEFPIFMDKLVLLLNAGLVISTALEKIAKEYKDRKEGRSYDVKTILLYEELVEIERKVNATNSPLLPEIKKFAKRSGVRELLRFSAVLAENMDKGAALSEKLEAEGELLWISRKKRAEELGRLAETKLILPLMILLLVFITIAIAPALMEI